MAGANPDRGALRNISYRLQGKDPNSSSRVPGIYRATDSLLLVMPYEPLIRQGSHLGEDVSIG